MQLTKHKTKPTIIIAKYSFSLDEIPVSGGAIVEVLINSTVILPVLSIMQSTVFPSDFELSINLNCLPIKWTYTITESDPGSNFKVYYKLNDSSKSEGKTWLVFQVLIYQEKSV